MKINKIANAHWIALTLFFDTISVAFACIDYFVMFDEIALEIPYQNIQYKQVTLTIKRLDLVHPQISGNKFFKLKYNFLEAKRQRLKKVLTFGGAYSNHIAATAFAAHQYGFKSVGIIRGEELANRPLNSTLQTAQQFGMTFKFVSREDYRQKDQPEYLAQLSQQFPEYYVIPEGGTNALAIRGCQEILSAKDKAHFDLICCAVGTGGTITGLLEASAPHQQVLGFSALKGDFLNKDVAQLTQKTNWQIIDDYCHGGYAKTTAELMQFIDSFETQYNIPLEHVYTAKMLYGIFDLIDQQKITSTTKILIIHSGGLQGRLASI